MQTQATVTAKATTTRKAAAKQAATQVEAPVTQTATQAVKRSVTDMIAEKIAEKIDSRITLNPHVMQTVSDTQVIGEKRTIIREANAVVKARHASLISTYYGMFEDMKVTYDGMTPDQVGAQVVSALYASIPGMKLPEHEEKQAFNDVETLETAFLKEKWYLSLKRDETTFSDIAALVKVKDYFSRSSLKKLKTASDYRAALAVLKGNARNLHYYATMHKKAANTEKGKVAISKIKVLGVDEALKGDFNKIDYAALSRWAADTRVLNMGA